MGIEGYGELCELLGHGVAGFEAVGPCLELTNSWIRLGQKKVKGRLALELDCLTEHLVRVVGNRDDLGLSGQNRSDRHLESGDALETSRPGGVSLLVDREQMNWMLDDRNPGKKWID